SAVTQGERSTNAIPTPTFAGDRTRRCATRPRIRSAPPASATSHRTGAPTGHAVGVGASTRIPVDERLTARATTPVVSPDQVTRTSRRKPTRGSVLLPSQPTMISLATLGRTVGEGKVRGWKNLASFENPSLRNTFWGAERRRSHYARNRHGSAGFRIAPWI